MEKETAGLSMAEREMIVVATSARNQCQYCVIAHGAILRIRARNPYIADQLATNYRKADISARQKAMLDYALKVSREAETVDESDYQKLNEFGFDDGSSRPAQIYFFPYAGWRFNWPRWIE